MLTNNPSGSLESIRKTKEYRNCIVSYIIENINYQNRNLGILSGISGELLLLCEYYKTNPNRHIGDKIGYLLDFCIDSIESGKSINPTFSSGLSGFAWTIKYLIESKVMSTSSGTVLNDFDTYIESNVSKSLSEGNIDLLNGAMGMALYLIERRQQNAVIAVLKFLENHKVCTDNGYYWIIDKSYANKGKYCDFGLAHGMAGILHFVSLCKAKGISVSVCDDLISGCIEFFQSNIQDFNEIGSYYPNLYSAEVFNIILPKNWTAA